LVTACLSDAAKSKIHNEYKRRIADGSIMHPNGGFDPRYYPGEVLASVMAIAQDTGDQNMMNWAVSQLELLRKQLEADNGFLIWPDQILGQPTFGELDQARLVISMALIYRGTGNATAKYNANLAFAALERLPLTDVKSSKTGISYRLPFWAYHDIANPTAISGRALDPNHEAVLVATYTVMGRFVIDDSARAAMALSKANSYLSAALDLAGSDKCLPLADTPEYRDVCDTRYNGYWGFMLELGVRHGAPNHAIRAIDGQFAYARPAILAFETRRTYPTIVSGPYPDPVEPLLWMPSAARNLSAAEFHSLVLKTNEMIVGDAPSSWPSGNLYPRFYE
jgi:hypothetical protein